MAEARDYIRLDESPKPRINTVEITDPTQIGAIADKFFNQDNNTTKSPYQPFHEEVQKAVNETAKKMDSNKNNVLEANEAKTFIEDIKGNLSKMPIAEREEARKTLAENPNEVTRLLKNSGLHIPNESEKILNAGVTEIVSDNSQNSRDNLQHLKTLAKQPEKSPDEDKKDKKAAKGDTEQKSFFDIIIALVSMLTGLNLDNREKQEAEKDLAGKTEGQKTPKLSANDISHTVKNVTGREGNLDFLTANKDGYNDLRSMSKDALEDATNAARRSGLQLTGDQSSPTYMAAKPQQEAASGRAG